MSTPSGQPTTASATLALLKLIVVNLAVVPVLLVWIYASSSTIGTDTGSTLIELEKPPIVALGLWVAASLVMLLAVGTNLVKLGGPEARAEDSVD